MHVIAISAGKVRHTEELLQVFKDLIQSQSPFTVQVSYVGSEMSVPFNGGKAINGLIEQSLRNVLKRTFGSIQYEHQQIEQQLTYA